MNCTTCRSQLSEFLERNLSPQADEALRQHLEGCTSCKRELRELKNTLEHLRETPIEEAPAELVKSVLALANPQAAVGERGRPPLGRAPTRGTPVGTVREIWETGAHDVLVVEDSSGRRHLLSTARELMPEVDPASGRIVVEILPGMLNEPDEG